MLRDSDQGFQYITIYYIDGRIFVASVAGLGFEGAEDVDLRPYTYALDVKTSGD